MHRSARLTGSLWANPRKRAEAPPRLPRPGRRLLQAGPRPPWCPLPAGAPWPAATSSSRGVWQRRRWWDSVGSAWGRGAAVRLYIWGGDPRDVRPRAGHGRWAGAGGCEREAAARSAAGNLWARPRAGWEKTAQLRPGPRAHGGGDRSLLFLLPHRRRRRLDLRALSMPRAGARLTANTPGLRGQGTQ